MWLEPMQHFHKRYLPLAVGLPVAAFLSFGVYRWVANTLKSDPFATYKKQNPDDLPENVALASTDTSFTRYESGNPKASFYVKKMTIARNRQVYDFEGVSNGQIEWKGSKYEFEGEQGNWNGFSKLLEITGKLRVKCKDFDVASKRVIYDELRRTISIPVGVDGTAMNGTLKVANLLYSMDSEVLETGAGEWNGTPSKNLFQDVPAENRTWKIKYDNFKKSSGIATYVNARAEDGEVIVIAPAMTWDEKQDVLTATGNVRYFGKNSNLIADKVVVYRKEKRAIFSGNVTMLVKPKAASEEPAKETIIVPLPPVVPESISKNRPPAPDSEDQKRTEEEIRSGKNLRDYPLILVAPQIEYWYKKGERRAKIIGSPQARQEMPNDGWRYAWANSAYYDAEREKLELFSSKNKKEVIVKNSIGDVFNAGRGMLSTKEDDDDFEFWEGSGTMTSRDEDLPPPDKKKGGGGVRLRGAI
jgi:hypothetical protein